MPRGRLHVERQVAPARVLAGVEVGEHAAGEVRERDAVAAVAERVVDVACAPMTPIAQRRREREVERTAPAVRDRDVGELGEVVAQRARSARVARRRARAVEARRVAEAVRVRGGAAAAEDERGRRRRALQYARRGEIVEEAGDPAEPDAREPASARHAARSRSTCEITRQDPGAEVAEPRRVAVRREHDRARAHRRRAGSSARSSSPSRTAHDRRALEDLRRRCATSSGRIARIRSTPSSMPSVGIEHRAGARLARAARRRARRRAGSGAARRAPSSASTSRVRRPRRRARWSRSRSTPARRKRTVEAVLVDQRLRRGRSRLRGQRVLARASGRGRRRAP